MTDSTGNLILEHLKAFRLQLNRMENDLSDVRMRVGQIEHKMVEFHLDIVLINGRLDKIGQP